MPLAQKNLKAHYIFVFVVCIGKRLKAQLMQDAWRGIWMAIGSLVLTAIAFAFPIIAGAIALLSLILGAADLIYGILAEINTANMMGQMNEQAQRMRHGS